MVGVFSLIQYLAAASNANGAAANGISQAQASSTDLSQLLAQNNQIMAEGGSSSTVTSTMPVKTSASTTLQTQAQVQTKKPRLIAKAPATPTMLPKPAQPQTQTQPQPQPQSANIIGSFMSILNNFLSIQNEATNSDQSSTPTETNVTTTTARPETATSTATSTQPTQATAPPPPPTPVTPITPPALSFALPYIVNNFSDLAGWQGTWGSVSVADGALDIGATTSTNGAEAVLTNSSDWTNYLATIKLNWIKGQTFSLIARRNPNSNVSCQFTSGGGISIKTTINGRQTLLGQGMEPGFTPTQPATAWIQVNNDRVQCGLNDAVVKDYLYYGLPPELLSGGIALNAWDPQIGNAEIQVKSIKVEGL